MRLSGVFFLTASALVLACGSPEVVGNLDGEGGGGSGTGGDGAGGNGTGAIVNPPDDCIPEECDGVCVGDICCETGIACGDACCEGGDVCSFLKCETPGDDCVDSTECPEDWYCEYSLGDNQGSGGGGGSCISGAPVLTGKCLPKPPVCPDGVEPDPDNPTCLVACEYIPPTSGFTPELKYAWGGDIASPFTSDVMMAPIVINLDDDDCDGAVTARDIPEIVFSTFEDGDYGGPGVLHAISILEGEIVEKWTVGGIHPTKQLAGGNVDGVPGNEVVGCTSDGRVRAVSGVDGSTVWTSPQTHLCFMPSLADLDQDGDVEVIVEGGILDGKTGALEHPYSETVIGPPIVSDVTGDGLLEIVTATQAFDATGQLLVDTGLVESATYFGTQDWKGPWPAVADIDLDGMPEVVVVDNMNHELHVWQYDPAAPNDFVLLRAPVDINGPLPSSSCPGETWGFLHGGGPPTIADFTGEGTPDVALAGGVGYVVFDGAALLDTTVAGPDTILWINPTDDCSSASTGSTVFDFNGDGRAEVVYSDQNRLRIYDGPNGDVLWETCNTNTTLVDYPLVADVDNDGHADIIAVSNAFTVGSFLNTCDDGTSDRQSGVRVFGDVAGEWVRTRRVWNEHGYHVTNVGEDGAIPQVEVVNYTAKGLNNFRQNKQPGSEFAAPDAVVSVFPSCTTPFAIVATVRNIGEAALPPVGVQFYRGEPPNGEPIGTMMTSKHLYPAESESLFLEVSPTDFGPNEKVYAIVDDPPTPHPEWTECNPNNNTSAPSSLECNAAK